MPAVPAELLAHRQWLGQIGQVGLVVSPAVLVKYGVVIDRQRSVEVQTNLAELVDDEEDARVADALTFFREILGWRDERIAGVGGQSEIPDALVLSLPEHDDHLRPTYAIRDPEQEAAWVLLVQTPDTDDFDRVPPAERHQAGWRASAHARLERLLRETGVPIGVLFNGTSLRLVYAPKGESSGHLTFRFRYLLETNGRPMAGALHALLADERISDLLSEQQRLPALLKESRKYQNDVSTALADQVLEALWELVRGFQAANEASKGDLLAQTLREVPQDVYGGLLTTLMRLVFILYAEDRGLMPAGDVYQRHYSVAGLFERLREDESRYPDTMDARFGAWAQLLALFRLIHDGGGHGALRFVARHGRLFDPDAYPFLEGRSHGTRRSKGDRVDPPRVSDGVVYRLLRNLLILDGERLSYRALDVEQIGSVYEAMMGFALEQAHGPSIAVAPKHVVINISELLEQSAGNRAKWLRERAELKLSSAEALSRSATVDEVLGALGPRVSRYTPRVVPLGALYLQPTEERRRSGSHYTPRSLTEPIVHTTFRPILERLGDRATPQQILDLKVCDPAMGSGAFLVESCRLLADRLVKAWEIHGRSEPLPPDEDELTLAKRLVAERCLYGVDKNIFAVDLAKLSLWLATLARDHPFTFLDHALRYGDSVVGLSREQIACFNWEAEEQLPIIRGLIDARVSEAQRLREQIQGLATSDDVPHKNRLLREVEEALADVRLIGDAVVSAFFERDKPKDRRVLRQAYAGLVQTYLSGVSNGGTSAEARSQLMAVVMGLREQDQAIPPFHWHIEFPEVFTRVTSGFDVVVGNPPFLGGTRISTVLGMNYFQWLTTMFAPCEHLCDLVAYFFRRAFDYLRTRGTFGLVATNTISQGDTREGGLRTILSNGGQIYAAMKRFKWPGSVAVVVSVVHVAKRDDPIKPFLDGRMVTRISAYLTEGTNDESPARLLSNPYFSLGVKIYGQGFLFADGDPECTPLSVHSWLLEKRPELESRIRPYIGGEEILSHPRQMYHRYVILLSDVKTEDDLAEWPELAEIVRNKVKPGRDILGDNPNNIPLKRRWWAFQAHRPELQERLASMERVLVTSQVNPRFAFAMMPANWIFSQKAVVFCIENLSGFATIQSRIHEYWARSFSSTSLELMSYTPSDCFETFPFPVGWESNAALEEIGRAYLDFRTALLVECNQGLTSIYNRFHDPTDADPRIVRLRELHDSMDRGVLDAYGWIDVQPACQFLLDFEDDHDSSNDEVSHRRKPYRYRWPDEIRDDVLGRLLQLNAERAAQEQLAGAATGPAKRAKKRRTAAEGGGLLETV
jgi:Eco57I restriction-modification methylase/MmeI, target recognition domain/MmeI, N-terminal domain